MRRIANLHFWRLRERCARQRPALSTSEIIGVCVASEWMSFAVRLAELVRNNTAAHSAMDSEEMDMEMDYEEEGLPSVDDLTVVAEIAEAELRQMEKIQAAGARARSSGSAGRASSAAIAQEATLMMARVEMQLSRKYGTCHMCHNVCAAHHAAKGAICTLAVDRACTAANIYTVTVQVHMGRHWWE